MTDKGKEKLEAAVNTFIDGAGKISSALLGMVNKVGGQIYAILFLNEEPLSLDEISEILSVSKSNVSINIRLLEDMKLVRKVWVKGSRKDFYSAERVYPKKVLSNFFDKIRGTVKDALTTIEKTKSQALEAKTGLDGEDLVKTEFILKQLGRIGAFYFAADKFILDFFEGREINVDLLRAAISNPESALKK